jgi:hypothetical protein
MKRQTNYKRQFKTKIIQAYLDKAITKDEMKILLTDGHAYTPVPWIFDNKKDKEINRLYRIAFEKVFNKTIPEINWI